MNDTPEDFLRMFKTAERAWRTGDLDNAERLFFALLKDNPYNAHVLNSLGVISLQQNKNEKGKAFLKKAISHQPGYTEPYQNLAILYKKCGELEKAVKQYELLLHATPDDSAAYLQAACLMIELKQYEKADRHLSLATSKFPDQISLWEVYGNFSFETGNLKKAKQSFKNMIKIDPSNLHAYYNLGLICRRLNDLKKAVVYFTDALKLSPDNVKVLYQLGLVYFDAGNLDKAIQLFESVIKKDGENLDAIFNAGVCYKMKNDLSSALNKFLKLIELKPDHLSANYNSGVINNETGDFSAAVKFFEKALLSDPDNPGILHGYGYALYRMANYDAAQKIYEKIKGIDSTIPDTYYNLGIIHKFKNNKEKAVQYLNTYISLGGNRASAEYEIATLTHKTIKSIPKEYVTKLFDEYAERFDKDLITKLKYNAPGILKNAFMDYLGTSHKFSSLCDLGCGTGLSGSAFKDIALRMTGVDLSMKMLIKAGEKQIYDELHQKDINTFLCCTDKTYDLFIAADLLIYVGDIDELFASVRKCMVNGGYFLLTTESCEKARYQLQKSGRYTHSSSYIREVAGDKGFSVEKRDRFNLRQEKKIWIPGEWYILKSK